MAGQYFIDGVVDDFLDDVQWVIGASELTWAKFNGIKAFEDGDVVFGVLVLFHGEGLLVGG